MKLQYGNEINVKDYNMLRDVVKWGALAENQAQMGLDNSAFIVSCMDGEKTIGCARLIWDGGYVAYIADVIALLLAIGIFELLFNAVINEIPRDEVEITAEVYPMEEIASMSDEGRAKIGIGKDSDNLVSVTLSDADDKAEQSEFTIQMPDFPEGNLTVTQDIVDTYDYITLIKWKSPYFLRAILWDIKEVNGERIMYIEHYRTTFLNSKEANSGSYTTSIEFGTLDKIIYLEKDGTETLLWEYEK